MEPLKNWYNNQFINDLGYNVKLAYPEFKKDAFIASFYEYNWNELELKQRSRAIVNQLGVFLPEFEKAVEVINKVAPKYDGYTGVIFPEFVEVFGLNHLELSLKTLEWVTRFSTAEFAIRPFIINYEKETMVQMKKWAKHENYHVRRLASEGCRPRLPWGVSLPKYKKDPSIIVPILDLLKEDEEDYVYRSVANNLNDISKDHPELVLGICSKWKSIDNKGTKWLIKHACRGLLKKGNVKALAIFGFEKPVSIEVQNLEAEQTELKIGEETYFNFEVVNQSIKNQKLRLEYKIYYMKSNGSLSPKVFQIKEFVLSSNSKEFIKRKISFENRTTRKHYPGRHKLVVVVNGVEVCETSLMVR